jgi:hypothetical protein
VSALHQAISAPAGAPHQNAGAASAEPWPEEARNVRLVGHSDLNGWGDAFQIHVRNGLCFVAASGANGHNGFTVLDVSNPRKPVVKKQVVDSSVLRTHKLLRITDDVLLTNVELRPGAENTDPDAVGGLRIMDTSDPLNPKFVRHVRVDGRKGVHRPIYDARRKLLYSSGYKDGFNGMVLYVHDMKDPLNPEQIGVGWVLGQKDGDTPYDGTIMAGAGVHLHEARPFLDHYVTCGYWNGGVAMFDLEDPTRPKLMWRQSPHETHGWPGRYHTFLAPEGSGFGIATAESVKPNCSEPPAFVTFYDLRNPHVPAIPVSTFMPHEIDPYAMKPVDRKWYNTGGRYGAHNLWGDMKKDDLLYICWFSAGLRIVDWSNPFSPKEVGYYSPAGNKQRAAPQSNDVYVDRDTGLIYLSDRWGLGLHILEYTG